MYSNRIKFKRIQIQRKRREFQKRSIVLKLPQSQNASHLVCLVCKISGKMHSFKIKWTKRLRDLAQNENTCTKIKSLGCGPVEVVVPNRVKFPQKFVLSGFKKENSI